MRFLRALAASSYLVSGAACGGGDLTLPEDQSPSEITAVAGNGQTGSVGSELSNPLVVRVNDAQGRPVPGVSVAFKLGTGADLLDHYAPRCQGVEVAPLIAAARAGRQRLLELGPARLSDFEDSLIPRITLVTAASAGDQS